MLCTRGVVWLLFFFFSSRRRHTRCSRDWSSDVCSSDLFGSTFPELSSNPCGEFNRIEGKRNDVVGRSEEHTSELQSRLHLVCRLLLEKKKKVIAILATAAAMSPPNVHTRHHSVISTSIL